MRRLWRYILAVGALQACDCSGSIGRSDGDIEFIFPTDGQILGFEHDEDPTTVGVQVTVRARADVRDGTFFELGDGQQSRVVAATGGEVSFARVTLSPGETVLTLRTESLLRSIRVSVEGAFCVLNSPRDDDVLGASDDQYPDAGNPNKPLESDVVVDCIGVPEGSYAALTVNDGLPYVVSVPAGGRLVFQKVAFADGQNTLVVSTQTNAMGRQAQGLQSLSTVRVERGRCAVSLSPGDGAVLNAATDLDLNPSNGMQADLLVTTDCALTSIVAITLQGPGDTSLLPLTLGSPIAQSANGLSTFRFAAVSLPESLSSYDVKLQALVDEGARQGATIVTRYWVDGVAPSFSSAVPTNGACFTEQHDIDLTTPGLQVAASGAVSGAAAGAEVWVHAYAESDPQRGIRCSSDIECDASMVCRSQLCRSVAVLDGSGIFSTNVHVPLGPGRIEFVAVDVAGNTSTPTLASYAAYSGTPTVSIASPSNGQVLVASDDQSPSLAGLQTIVDVNVSNAIAGSLGTLTVSGQNPVGFPVSSATETVAVPVSLSDGSRTLVARVNDGCGVPTQSAPITIQVASQGALVGISGFTADNAVCAANTDMSSCTVAVGCLWVEGVTSQQCVADLAARTVIDDSGSTGALQADFDIALGTADIARDVTVSLYDGVTIGASGRACSGSSTLLGTKTVAAASSGFWLVDVLLQQDTTNCIEVISDDGLNPVTETFVLTQRSLVPTPSITDPTASAVLNSDSNPSLPGFNYTVEVALSGGANPDGSHDIDGVLELALGFLNTVEVAVPAGQTTVTLSDLSLPQGSYSLTPAFRDAFGNRVQGMPVPITVDADAANPQPLLALTSPVDGSHIFKAALAITVELLGGDTPTTCDLYMTASPTSPDAPLIDDEAWSGGSSHTFTNPSLTDGTYYVRAVCDSPSGVGESQIVAVVLDDTAPSAPTLADEPVGTPGRLVFSVPGGFVNQETGDVSSSAGLQHDVRVLVDDGGEDVTGWTIELTVTPPGGTPTVYSRLLPASQTFVVDFGSADGPIDFSVTVSDRVGNVSTADVASLTIDTNAPTVTQTVPDPAKTTLTSSDDINVSTQELDLNFSYTVADAPLGADCEADPSLCLSLRISPEPEAPSASLFPLRLSNNGSTLTFPTVSLVDGAYAATAEITDLAGNRAQLFYAFDVLRFGGGIQFLSPSTGGFLALSTDASGDPGYQDTFTIRGTGYAAGTEVNVCSNVNPPGAGPFTPCRWGYDGTDFVLGGPDAGIVVGSATFSGSLAAANAFVTISLSEGAQKLHAEAMESDGEPDLATVFLDFVVDLTPPAASFTLDANDPSNDDTVVRLNATEGTVAGSALQTPVTVNATGAVAGAAVELLSDNPAPNTVVASGTLGGTLDVTLTPSLSEVSQTLSVRVVDAAGNWSDPTSTELDVWVDFTAGTAIVPVATFAPHTQTHGVINDNGDPSDRSVHTLEIDIQIQATDNKSLQDTTLTLERYASAGASTPDVSVVATLSAGETNHTFSSFPLVAGQNFLEAVFVDAAGNEARSSRVVYGADLYGPTLSLEVRFGAAVQTCTSDPGCTADVLDPAVNGSRSVLDRSGSDSYCPPLASPCNTAGTDLFFTLTDCSNSDALYEDCSVMPISVSLESRIGGTTDPLTTVYSSTWASSADEPTAVSYFTKAMATAFAPGISREIRVKAVDANGNVSYSHSVSSLTSLPSSTPVFLELNHDGVLITVERIVASGPADIIADDRYFGIAENVDTDPGEFATDLRITAQSVAGGPVATDVDLQINGGAVQSQALSGGSVDFTHPAYDLNLVVSSDPQAPVLNTLSVTANCSGPVCGQATLTGLVADIDAPTYEFNRCSLCALDVPLVDTSAWCPANCGTAVGQASANIQDPAVEKAIWNAANDQDGNPSNGFTISTTPLIVDFSGLENGELVTLVSNQGGLSGATALSNNCATNCQATFSSLGVPSLTAGLEHELSVEASDRAGNTAVVNTGRVEEVIYALTDVISPDAVTPTACIGESNTPTSVTNPASDLETYEDPACDALCTASANCDRREGLMTVGFVAPADDGASGENVTDYVVSIAALGIPYDNRVGGGTTTYADCANFDPSVVVPEQELVMAASAAPGGTEWVSISGLYIHRSYCVHVVARDELSNASTVVPVRRDVPLVTYPDVGDFRPWEASWSDHDASLLRYVDEDSTGPTYLNFGYAAKNVGDLDGDTQDDVAIARWLPGPMRMYIFLSSDSDSTSPMPIIIDEPTISSPSGTQFATSFGGGDFDGDGRSDLAICATTVSTSGGTDPGNNSGALYLYWGTLGTGIRTDANTTDSELPSIFPDVALLANQGEYFCNAIQFADVNATTGTDLVVMSSRAGKGKVYGFTGGSRARFGGSPPTTSKVRLDLDSSATSGITERPDFAIRGNVTYHFAFPQALETADIDGDGKREVIISDHFALHGASRPSGSGHVYVYSGGSALSGEINTPNSPAGALKHILRAPESPEIERFGNTMLRVPAPVSGDSADWLLVQNSGGNLGRRVFVFRGTSFGGSPGIVPGSYPVGGLAGGLDDYTLLDRTDWDGTVETGYGFSLAAFGAPFDGHGGTDICVGPASLGPTRLRYFFYSFNTTSEAFEKRAIWYGQGGQCVNAGTYLTGASAAPQVIITSEPEAGFFVVQ